MPTGRANLKAKILKGLTDQIASRNNKAQADDLIHFTQSYYRLSPVEELEERSVDNLYGATLSCWSWLQSWKGKAGYLRVFNPDLETHGWQSGHTVIQLIEPDAPFLLDSVRLELTRLGLGIHIVHSGIIWVETGSNGVRLSTEGQGDKLCLVYIEIDRTSDASLIKAIADGIKEVLTDLEAAVLDYHPMLQKAQELGAQFKKKDDDDSKEAAVLIDWMVDNHFTFLGYDELTYTKSRGRVSLKRDQGSALGVMKVYGPKGPETFKLLSKEEAEFRTDSEPVVFTKDYHRSRVHRPAYQDVIAFKKYDAKGVPIGEHRFLGLYTSPVYIQAPLDIPVVRKRVLKILKQTGFASGGHAYKSLHQAFVEMPRDELMLCIEQELFVNVMGIFSLQERRKVRLLTRRDISGNFFTFLYFVPKDIFNTQLRSRVQALLCERLGVEDSEFTTYYSESILTRVYFVLPSRGDFKDFDPVALEAEVVELSRSWDEDLIQGLLDKQGEEQGNRLAERYRHAFPAAYKEHFKSGTAVADIDHLEEVTSDNTLSLSFYRQIEQSGELLRFKLFSANDALILSDVIPILENLGMRVLGEHPYKLKLSEGKVFWIHDFSLEYQSSEEVDLEEVKQLFQDAFANIWSARAENDSFNRLVIGAHLSWREVAMLRAYARYNQQIRLGFSQPYIAATLARHLQIARLLFALFRAKFEPNRQQSEKVKALSVRLVNSIQDGLDRVENLNDDKILRRYLELIQATLRTNFFQRDASGELHSYFSFKLNPRAIEDIPQPRPMFEIFVYSPQIEGVHLRGGKVARGGLRWSDRMEDYRTEVLGLVKAQQVKNAVIVPVGAKGGFVAKTIPENATRDEVQRLGIEAYKTFISGLLDVTDNLVNGQVEPPQGVVRLDEDDPYLVVAADKGTATFSDIANEIADQYNFWLGDAFASGGSQGYDHKKMAITAKGAWESVKLHFREKGLDTQAQPFSVIGIGDMSGDVFGNGMLLSEQIKLVAAFNHLHIFIDPNPDPATSFVERQRLFDLPRSGWGDYNEKLISKGGGVFSRSGKWIDLTPEIRERFDIKQDRLAPNDLISVLLKSPVDLLWNGGIGTYVKATQETHADVGDKANDSLRVNAAQLRAKVIGEGGNLGFTQLARVEFSKLGGACNTDFIDNAGGVDCSDHEVNIKIALQSVLQAGDLTVKQRNLLLKQMTDRISSLVLKNNYRQALSLALAERQLNQQTDDYLQLIQKLESSGRLNRSLENLPSDEQLAERAQAGAMLTRPELSVLISYVKGELKEQLNSDLINQDAYIAKELYNAFPEQLAERFDSVIVEHRLRAEIIATQLANSMVNQMGIIFPLRVQEATGRSMPEIAAAWVAARDIYQVDKFWQSLENLDNQVSAEDIHEIMGDIQRLMRRVCVWLLRHTPGFPDAAGLVERFGIPSRSILSDLGNRLAGEPLIQWQEARQRLIDSAVPDELAEQAASLNTSFALLDIISISEENGKPLDQVCEAYFELGDKLALSWFEGQVKGLEVKTRWQIQAREVFRESLNELQYRLTLSALNYVDETEELAPVHLWCQRNEKQVERWKGLIKHLRSYDSLNSSIVTVALRELADLARS